MNFLSYFMPNDNPVTHEEVPQHRIILKEESFYLLGFVSWMHPFEDLSRWEFRAGNNGFFALISCVFLFGQMSILFDLAYEEDQIDYKCQGNSARFAVATCGVLVTLLVAMKMLPEERRCFGQRLVLNRHATEFPLFESTRGLLFGPQRIRSLKLLICTIFHGFRQYGVIVFIYVSVIEQLMQFETILDYIINCVVVLVIAELDDLAFKCLARVELSEAPPHGTEPAPSTNHSFGGLRNPVMGREYHSVNSASNANAIEQYLLKAEEGEIPPGEERLIHGSDEHSANVRSSIQLLHHRPADIHEMVTLHLSHREYDAYLSYDYWILRFNFFFMILPLLNAKITGANCGEHSVFRVSEIGMFALMVSRVLLNVYVDFLMTRNQTKTLLDNVVHTLGSLIEHTLPCVGYVALMYLVFVEEFKPNRDDLL